MLTLKPLTTTYEIPFPVAHQLVADAKAAFFDEAVIVFHDSDHSDEEGRFILLELSVRSGVLVE